MSVNLTASLQAILNSFGTPVLTSISGYLNTGSVVFLSGFVETQTGGSRFTGAEPLIMFKTADFPGVARGDAFFIDQWYFCRDVQPDETGATYCRLNLNRTDKGDQSVQLTPATFTETVTTTEYYFTDTEYDFVMDGGSFA